MPKYLRTILKTLAWGFLSLVLVFGVTWGLIQLPSIQLSLTQKAGKWISERTQTRIEVGGVDIDFFHTLVLENVYLEDPQKDTLAYAGRISVNIGIFSLLNKEVFVDEISLKNATVHLHRTDSVYNFQFLVEAFSDSTSPPPLKDSLPTASPWKYGLKKLSLNNVYFHLDDKTDGYEITCKLPKGYIALDELALNSQRLLIDDISLSETFFAYHVYSETKDTASGKRLTFPATGWAISANNVGLDNISLLYRDHTKQAISKGVDYNHIYLTETTLSLKDLQVLDSLIGGKVEKLAFTEKSGLTVESLTGATFWTPKALSVENLVLKTPESRAFLTATLSYNEVQQLGDFAPGLQLYGEVRNTSVAFRDILLLAPNLASAFSTAITNEYILLEGKITGSPSKLNGINWKVSTGKATKLVGDFRIGNLMVPEEMDLELDIQKVSTEYSEVQRLLKNPLPSSMKPLGEITYSGTYKGTIYGGELKGNLDSGVGSLSSDLNATFNNNYDNATYRGELSFNDFDLGKLIQNDSLGTLTLRAKVEGSGITMETISTQLDAVVAEATFNRYNYEDIEIHGQIQQKQFIGKVDIKDKNLQLDFDGEVDFNDSIPNLQFTALLDTLNLRNLHLSEDSIGFHGDFFIGMTGITVENLNGLAEIRNLRIGRADLQYAEDTIRLNARIRDEIRSLVLTSDFAQMNLEGDYRFVSLPRLFINFVNDYFPVDQFITDIDKPDSLRLEPVPQENPPDQSFIFSLRLNKPNKILQLFVPEVKKLDSLVLTANLDSKKRKLKGNLYIPGLHYQEFLADSINMVIDSDLEKISYSLLVENFRTAQAPESVNLYGNIFFGDQKLDADIQIKKDTLEKLVKIGALATFKNGEYLVNLKESFYLNNKKWDIDSTHNITLAQSVSTVSNLELSRGKQELSINGSSNDSLNIHFDKFKVSEISSLLGYEDDDVNGRIIGDIHIIGLASEPYFTSDLNIRDISLNQEPIGDWLIKAGLSQDGNQINVDSRMRGRTNFDIAGSYEISSTVLNLQTDIRNFQLPLLNPFLGEFLSETSGQMKGNLKVTGTTNKPQANGELRFEHAAARINYLNTYYKLTNEKIAINPGSINFKNFSLVDTLGGKGILDGAITHNFFENIQFNLNFSSPKFQFLDTKPGDNELFYGKMLLGMNASITGTLDNTKMAIKAKTLSGTDLVVLTPSDESGVVQEDYLVFVSPKNFNTTLQQDSTAPIKKLKANLLGYNIDLLLEITPDAKLTYIIDPLSGDNIDVQGNANLNVSINSLGDISMLGNYEVTRGKYRFSFESIVKREFQVNPGSQITFIGDPFESQLDITAVYKTRTPVYDLISNQLTDPNGSVAKEARRRSDIEVLLYIQGKAMKPDLSFNIMVPEAEKGGLVSSSLARRLAQIRENESELNKQVFGLLLFNSFVGDNQSGIGGANLGSVAVSSVSNFINGQLNSLADKYVKGIEFNINLESYQSTSGGETSAISELEVGLSKQLFNERMTVSVGTGIGLESSSLQQASDTQLTQISGNFVLNYKLTEDGRYSLRVFRKSDADDSLNGGGNTRVKTGIGASYKRSF
ncbi:translocation/assembly module TamB domain-containing protein [bacterium]|nr:translocation/assembly module TamB domain-containing protein [bacterium]